MLDRFPIAACRGSAILFLWLTVHALSAGSLRAQAPVDDEADQPPKGWHKIEATTIGARFWVPESFTQLKPSRYRPISLQGVLGGSRVRLHLNVLRGQFETVSRFIATMTADARIEEVVAFRIDNEPAAIVRRQTSKKPRRQIYEAVVCPRHHAVSLEIQLPPSAGAQAAEEARRLLRFFRPIAKRGFTQATPAAAATRTKELELGFTGKQLPKVTTKASAHYRLYTTSAVDQKLLDFLEEELAPRLTRHLGGAQGWVGERRLPIFLHRTRDAYVLAAQNIGIPREQARSMAGYAWDRYYATWYKDAHDPIHIHEGTHQFVTAILGLDGGGPWLQEGLAEWIEADYTHANPKRRGRNLLKRTGTEFPTLAALLAAESFENTPAELGSLQKTEIYDIAASLVQFLAIEQHNEFRDLLLQLGVLPSGQLRLTEAAFVRTIGIDLKELECKWKTWLRRDT